MTLADPAVAATSGAPDWPCVQRKVPEVYPGMVWACPSLEEPKQDRKSDAEVRQLAGSLAGELDALPANEKLEREELEQQRLRDTLIYQDRERSLPHTKER